jgi:hypothetical protein
MVKFSNPSQFDAQYESQQRTVGVSLKPSIGKELFGRQDIVEATGGAFKSHFATERFIHNDIRKYLLRSSTHWQSVQNEMSTLNAARFDNSREEGSIYSPLPEAASYRMLAEKISSDTSVDLGLHLPAGIRENVVARLLHEAGVQVDVDYSSGRSSDRTTAVGYFTGDENRTSDRSQYAFKIDQASTGSIKADGFSSAVHNNSVSRHENSNTGKELSSDFATAIDLSNAFSHIVQEKSNSGYIRVLQARSGLCLPAGTEVSKMVLAESREALLCSFAARVFLCAAGGFGTSPIWYQQSMATGPPPNAFSLN